MRNLKQIMIFYYSSAIEAVHLRRNSLVTNSNMFLQEQKIRRKSGP